MDALGAVCQRGFAPARRWLGRQGVVSGVCSTASAAAFYGRVNEYERRRRANGISDAIGHVSYMYYLRLVEYYSS
eukprot:6017690-Prymnesium_polylepis.4